jgi:hypothetical protein
MLPLTASSGWTYAEILICGGSQFGAYLNPSRQLPASQTCGRILPLATNPAWVMENMPIRRNMGDMILLPTRQVLIINGAENGSQGWGFATNAVLNPVLYNPGFAAGTRFQTLTATTIPRVYHSTANLLADGRILVAGSNTHQFYTFTQPFPTELRIEAFSPPYLSVGARPAIATAPAALGYNKGFTVKVTFAGVLNGVIELNLLSAPFVTHSYAQVRRRRRRLALALSHTRESSCTTLPSVRELLTSLSLARSSLALILTHFKLLPSQEVLAFLTQIYSFCSISQEYFVGHYY